MLISRAPFHQFSGYWLTRDTQAQRGKVKIDQLLKSKGLFAAIVFDPNAKVGTLPWKIVNSDGTFEETGDSIVTLGATLWINIRRNNGQNDVTVAPIEDVFEHELQHVRDIANGIGVFEGDNEFLEASDELIRYMFPIPGEGRAINHTNRFRDKKDRGYFRVNHLEAKEPEE